MRGVQVPNTFNPFGDMLIGVNAELRDNGSPIPPDLEGASIEQSQVVSDITSEASRRDIQDQMIDIGRSVQNLNKILSGISSDDILINVDPQTGQSFWEIRPKTAQAEEGGSSLPDGDVGDMLYHDGNEWVLLEGPATDTNALEFMGVFLRDDGNGNIIPTYDFVRSSSYIDIT